jgi:hypothetical protein
MWHVWGREVCTGCWWGNLRESGHWGRPRPRWEDIKIDLQEVGGFCGDWMELAQDRDRWRALVSTVKNFGFHKYAGNFLINCIDLLASQEGLCSME